MSAEPRVPWDVYVDECKARGGRALGFLVVPNSPSFMHKLYRSRFVELPGGGRILRRQEIHWNRPRGDTLPVAREWIRRVFQHRGARFFRKSWPGGWEKQAVIVDFLARFCETKRLKPPYNVVLFLDFDDQHAAGNIQNAIRTVANIARCYHLDSRNNDLLQCCDLMLGATGLLNRDPSVTVDFDGLDRCLTEGHRLPDSGIKRYLAGFLGKNIDRDPNCVYNLGCGGSGPMLG